MKTTQPVFLDSITDAGPAHRGAVVACGSHGGLYPAALASAAGLRAVIFNDAGIGLERAGIAGMLRLAQAGMAAAAVDCNSCHIGSATDTARRGVISRVNESAAAVGVKPGMAAGEALRLLAQAPLPDGTLPPPEEARQEVELGRHGLCVVLVDSASLVGPPDAGRVVITGSHGGLIGADPARAIKAPVRVAVFNDAGRGADDIGISRLPALDARAIAALAVSCRSARIGEAASALESGVLSAANAAAARLGARPGMALRAWLETLPPGE